MSAAVRLFYAILLSAIALAVAGVYVMLGAGPTLLCASVLLFALAGFIRNGLA